MRDVHIVVGIHVKDGQVLLVQQKDYNKKLYWSFPAGKVESGETLIEALFREVKEESGLTVHKVHRLAYTAQNLLLHRKIHSTTFAFLIESVSGALAPNDPDGSIIEARYFDIAEAKKLIALHQPLAVMLDPALQVLENLHQSGPLWIFKQDEHNSKLIAKI